MMKSGTPHAVTLGQHDAQILQMRKDGHNYLQIGSELECSRETIKRRLDVLQGMRPKPGKHGRPRHAVTLGKLDADLLLMVAKGVDPLVMGIKLRCSETTVLSRLAALRNQEA